MYVGVPGTPPPGTPNSPKRNLPPMGPKKFRGGGGQDLILNTPPAVSGAFRRSYLVSSNASWLRWRGPCFFTSVQTVFHLRKKSTRLAPPRDAPPHPPPPHPTALSRTRSSQELETSLGEKNAEMTEWGEQQQKLADLIGKASLLLGPKRARSDLSFSLSPSGSLRRGDSLSGHTPGARSPGNDKLADISNLGPREVAGKGHAAPEAFYAPRLTSGP